jgi:hypothetical protein
MYALNGRRVETRRFATRAYLDLVETDPRRYAPLTASSVSSFEHELG